MWHIAENFEAEPGYRLAGRVIREGRIRKVLFFEARVVNYIDQESKWYQTPWRTVPDVSDVYYLEVASCSCFSVVPRRVSGTSR